MGLKSIRSVHYRPDANIIRPPTLYLGQLKRRTRNTCLGRNRGKITLVRNLYLTLRSALRLLPGYSGRTCINTVGATKYDVEVYKDEAMTQKTVAGTVSSTAVSLSNVKSGKTYYVRVRAKGTIDGYDMVSEWSISSFGDEAGAFAVTGSFTHSDCCCTPFMVWIART